MKLVSALLLALLVPTAAFAQATSPRVSNPYEAACRKALGLKVGELLPGPSRGTLRNCVRSKASNARRDAASRRSKRPTLSNAQEEILKRIEEQIGDVEDIESSVQGQTTAQVYEAECRDEMGITNQILQPGPMRGNLRNCIRQKYATKTKEENLARKKESLRQRQTNLHKQVLQQKTQNIDEQLRDKSSLYKHRIRTYSTPDPNVIKTINDSLRSRIDLSRTRAPDSRTIKRNNAEKCRAVPSSQWAQCIREALGGDQ